MISLQNLNKDGIELSNFIGIENDYIKDLYNQDCVVEIIKCINELDERDKESITNLLIKEKTERELAELNNVTQPAIHKRKNLIIKRLEKR